MPTIYLDWPSSDLSPNSRIDRRARAAAVRYHRELAWIQAQRIKGWEADGVELSIIFYPPDKRRRDLDNCYSMCKPYQDGIFQALGIDDSRIALVELRFGRVRDGGVVEFHLRNEFEL